MISIDVKAKFRALFGREAALYTSPGRINLIGEHTDYNEGFVMPGAIDCGILVGIALNGSRNVRVCAADMGEQAEFGLREEDLPEQPWARYIFGVCREMEKRGARIEGFDALFAGDVPLGAGLSSSAALECAFAYALNDLCGAAFDSFELARIGQATEHNYCGVMCGIMDQFASVFGKKGSLIRLDCRSLEYTYFPFEPKGYRLLLLDSLVKHELVDSPYNRRRESCERVAAAMGRPSLRGATSEDLEALRGQIAEEDYLRASYVIGEEHRVMEVCEALRAGDYEAVGEQMYRTHDGLSKLYQVSCEELDYLVDIARECGVAGARIMGGGFGGCTINLVRDALYEPFVARAKRDFAKRYGHEPRLYDVVIGDGARRVE